MERQRRDSGSIEAQCDERDRKEEEVTEWRWRGTGGTAGQDRLEGRLSIPDMALKKKTLLV